MFALWVAELVGRMEETGAAAALESKAAAPEGSAPEGAREEG
jgi:hypothetical protein